MANNPAGGRRLRDLSEAYADRLHPETRRRVLASVAVALETSRGSRRPAWSLMSLAPQAVSAVALLMLLALPAVVSRQAPEVRTPVQDLEVRADGSKIYVTWSDGGQPRRVVRATSREELAHLAEAPGVTVNGERWVDDRSASEAEPIVYYYVE